MATTVNMPQLGETVTEGTILSWPKKVGDTIREDEVLVEVSTDKVDTEIPSPVEGTILEILVQAGETVNVGTPMVVIGEAGEQVAATTEAVPEPAPAIESTPAPEPAEPVSAPPAPASAPVAPPATSPVAATTPEEAAPELVEEQRFLSPVVRKLARENDLDLSQICLLYTSPS